MGEQCCRAGYTNPECSARRWHPTEDELLRAAGADVGRRSDMASRHAAACERVGPDVVSARMRLLYDYRAPAGTRWSPTAEQLRELLALFHIGGVRTPSTAQISRITARLRAHGRIEGRNVFYWFQNQKARERKRRLQLQLHQNPAPSSSHEHQQSQEQPPATPKLSDRAQQDGGGVFSEGVDMNKLWEEQRSELAEVANVRPPAREGSWSSTPDVVNAGMNCGGPAARPGQLAHRTPILKLDTSSCRPAAMEDDQSRSDVSDAADVVGVQHRLFSIRSADMDVYPSCVELAHSSASTQGRFQDFDEIDSVADLAASHIFSHAEYPTLYSPPSTSYNLPTVLALFPLAPAASRSASPSSTHEYHTCCMHSASSNSFFHSAGPYTAASRSDLHGHPHAAFSSPSASCTQHDPLLELKLTIDL